MNYAELIEKLQILPEDKQAEVFDFVDYLAERFSHPAKAQFEEWSERGFSDLSLSQAMRGLEEETGLYTEADLKERWQ